MNPKDFNAKGADRSDFKVPKAAPAIMDERNTFEEWWLSKHGWALSGDRAAKLRWFFQFGNSDVLWEVWQARALIDSLAKVSAQVTPEMIAAAIAHRACCGVEHDAANGKLHGCCVVCGVPWPCATAQTFLFKPAPAAPLAARHAQDFKSAFNQWLKLEDMHFPENTLRPIRRCAEWLWNHYSHARDAALVEVLQRYMGAYPAFRMKPEGAPGSQVRIEQENLMALEDAARAAIASAPPANQQEGT